MYTEDIGSLPDQPLGGSAHHRAQSGVRIVDDPDGTQDRDAVRRFRKESSQALFGRLYDSLADPRFGHIAAHDESLRGAVVGGQGHSRDLDPRASVGGVDLHYGLLPTERLSERRLKDGRILRGRGLEQALARRVRHALLDESGPDSHLVAKVRSDCQHRRVGQVVEQDPPSLLGRGQLGHRGALHRDVGGNPDETDDMPSLVTHRRHGQPHGKSPAGRVDVAPLPGVGFAASRCLDEDLEARVYPELGGEAGDLRSVMEQARRFSPDDVRGSVTEHPLGPLIERRDESFGSGRDDGVPGGRSEYSIEVRCQQRLRALTFRQLVDDALDHRPDECGEGDPQEGPSPVPEGIVGLADDQQWREENDPRRTSRKPHLRPGAVQRDPHDRQPHQRCQPRHRPSRAVAQHHDHEEEQHRWGDLPTRCPGRPGSHTDHHHEESSHGYVAGLVHVRREQQRQHANRDADRERGDASSVAEGHEAYCAQVEPTPAEPGRGDPDSSRRTTRWSADPADWSCVRHPLGDPRHRQHCALVR